jgi:Putative Ig domain/Galactose oxidase, central domain
MKKLRLSASLLGGSLILHACGGGGGSTTTPPPATATSLSVSAPSNSAVAGTSFNVTVQALSASGAAVSNYAGTVHFTSTDAQAVLPNDMTLTNGTGTFSVTLKTAGSQGITATDAVTSSIAGAASINVSSAATAQLTLTAPLAATTGIAVNVTISAMDAYSNVATNYSGTVHFTSSDAQAMLPANPPLTGGAGSFSVTLKTIGSQTIVATDTVTASLRSTSSPISVVSNAATHLSVSSSGSSGTRANFSFTVSALDAANNVSAGYSGTVHFTSSDTQAHLPSNSILTAGISTGLTAIFETTGTQTLVATDTTTASLNGSSSISVTATAALTSSSGSPPTGTVGVNYGAFRTQYYKCIFSPLRGWSCSPCIPGFGCGSYPSCYISNPCLLKKLVFVGFTFTATGGVPPYGWSATGLPPGLTLNSSTGNLLGTPTSPGTYGITVTATDSGIPAVQTSQNYTITINNPPPPAVNTTPPPPPGVENLPYSFTFTASGYGTLTWSESGALPAGLAFNNSSATLSGTPTQTGSFPITVTATDQFKQDSTPANLTIVVTLHGFVATGSMATARRFHTATLLGNGKVLVAGGEDAGATAFASAELYDPSTGTFSPTTGPMTIARVGHTATLLSSGKVLITGGTSDATEAAVASAELYDPAADTFTATTGSMSSARVSHTATQLSDGRVLVAGGDAIFFNGVQNTSIKSLASAEIFDPNTGTFAATGNMTAARESHTATLLNDGRVLVAGGCDGAVGNTAPAATAYSSSELFDPSTGHFTAAGMMTTTRVFQTANLLTSGAVLVAGGLSNNGTKASADLFNPTGGNFAATGTMAELRFYQDASTLNDGTVLLSGGSDDATRAKATAEVYDPTAGTFSSTGSMIQPRVWHTSTLLKTGKVLVTGGAGTDSAPVATAEVYQ